MKAENMRDWEGLLGVSVHMHTSLHKNKEQKKLKKTVLLANCLSLRLLDLANSKNVKHFVTG